MTAADTNTVYDVVIAGAGPAAMQAAIYLSRADLKTLVIGYPDKSQLYKAHVVGNYYGVPTTITGPQLIENATNALKEYGVPILQAEVVAISQKEDKTFVVKTQELKEYKGKSTIIATGRAYKMANIKNEEPMTGKGVHYCVPCDGYFYRNKKIAVIGRQNFAAEEALRAHISQKGGSFLCVNLHDFVSKEPRLADLQGGFCFVQQVSNHEIPCSCKRKRY